MSFAVASSAPAADATLILKDAFKDFFPIGTAVNRSMMTGGAGFRRGANQNAADLALLEQHFNQFVAENDTKWQLIHPREGQDGYEFSPTDALVNFGLSNKMEVAGHTLVWHSQTPNWVFAGTNPPAVGAANATPPGAAANTSPAQTNHFGRGGFGGGFGRYNGRAPRATNCSSG